MPGNNITLLTSFKINYLYLRHEDFMAHEFTKMFSCCQLCPNWVEIQDLRDLICLHYKGCGEEEMFADRSTGSFSLHWSSWWETDQVSGTPDSGPPIMQLTAREHFRESYHTWCFHAPHFIMRNLQKQSYSKNSQPLMEPQGSLPCSQ